MIGPTLLFSISGLFTRWILGLFLGTSLLAFLIDMLELIRNNADDERASLGTLALVSALRIPLITEQILPFAVLIGAIATLVTLSRRSELAVARAAGLSVWQFTAPGILVALFLGFFSTLAYNPMATWMKGEADRLAFTFSGAASMLDGQSSAKWLRQKMPDGEAVMSVSGIADSGRLILKPVFWLFDGNGRLSERVEAESGRLEGTHWRLTTVTVVTSTGMPAKSDYRDIPTALTPEQIRGGLAAPEAVSFWDLPQTISDASASGLPPYRFRLQFHVLLSRPILLAAMVLIAATVSLGVVRSGGLGKMILGGVTAGFVLYVVTEIARDLGSEGLVPAVLAAWSPAVVAAMLGATVLLYREDG